MDYTFKDGRVQYSCGCSFQIIGEPPFAKSNFPAIKYNPDTFYPDHDINFACPAAWELLMKGQTVGVFQLESPVGQSNARKLKPDNMNELAALSAIIRPGCVSGDTSIALKLDFPRPYRNFNFKKSTIRDLYKKFVKNHNLYERTIVSADENTNTLFNNQINLITYSGDKEVYKPKFKVRRRTILENSDYNLECTLDHKLLTHDRGWVELQNLIVGERVAVINNKRGGVTPTVNIKGQKYFQEICFHHYKYHCIFCDWKDGSLDVNHIEGNRKTNNHPDNLCFMCPNHHRMYSEGNVSKEDVLSARSKYILNQSEDIQWVEYYGKEFIGVKDTYDIGVDGPNHNFIAGNVVVHNCSQSRTEDGVTMTEHYCKRKNFEEDFTFFHDSLRPALEKTWGILIYQESAMRIAQDLAGFTEQEADGLRKAIGKKLPEEMAKIKILFIDGCKKMGIVSDEIAAQIFDWIEKSQRYSFNRSHAIGYGILGYICAYTKVHFPIQYYTSCLLYAQAGSEAKERVNVLTDDAKLMDIYVLPPDLTQLENNFYTDGQSIYFGLSDIKDVGPLALDRIKELLAEKSIDINTVSWYDFLLDVLGNISITVAHRIIETGALRRFDMPRKRMIAEYDIWHSELKKDTERQWILDRRDEFTDICSALKAVARVRKEGGGCFTKTRVGIIEDRVKSLENPPNPFDDSPDWISWCEKEYLGISLTYSELDKYDVSRASHTCKDIVKGHKAYAVLGVELKEVKPWKTKTGKSPGQEMAFIKAADTSCALDIVVFPKVWKEFSHLLTEGNIVFISGKMSKGGSFQVEKVYPVEDE